MSERDWIVEIMNNMLFEEAPEPWRHVDTAIAGLESVGYAQDTDYLLAIGANGRTVFDCSFEATSLIAALDYDIENEQDWNDRIRLVGEGIGSIANQSVQLAGIFGGGLRIQTSDHWRLEMISPNWPHSDILLGKPDYKLFRVAITPYIEGYTKLKLSKDDLVAYGFSQTDKSFVVAYSSTIHIFSRP